MWHLESLKAKNIQTIQDIEYTLSQGITTLIFGKNLDNPTQLSNGSGKSALLEVIVMGTRGKPQKNVRIDEQINNDATKAETEVVYVNDDTGELMRINREFFKKSTNTISVYLEKDGVPVDSSTYVQSSLDEYTDFIFKKLGITDEEFVNNFAVSKHRYESFLDASDTKKKETINKWSNVDKIIDPATARVCVDIKNQESLIHETELNIAKAKGTLEATVQQLSVLKIQSSTEERAKKRSELERLYKEKLDNVSNMTNSLATIQTSHAELEIADNIIGGILEDWDMPQILTYLDNSIDASSPAGVIEFIETCIEEVKSKMAIISQNDIIIANTIEDNELQNEKLADFNIRYQSIQKNNEINNKAIERISESFKCKHDDISSKMAYIDEIVKNNNSKESDIRKKIATFESSIRKYNNVLSGKITCPKCSHEFVLNSEMSVEDMKLEIDKSNKLIKESNDSIAEIELSTKESNERTDELKNDKKKLNDDEIKKTQAIHDALLESNTELSELSRSIVNVTSKIKENEDYITKLNSSSKKIVAKKRQISSMTLDIKMNQESADSYKEAIDNFDKADVTGNIEVAEKNIAIYENRIVELEKEQVLQSELLDVYKQQEIDFINFKAYLANSKIDELGNEINTFLEKTGSDIRILFSGYTTTKTGKTREKISVSVLRDGVDFGSFGKLSEGEKATVQVATILAQQRLINSVTSDGNGLNLLVIDEIIDMIDYKGLSCIFEVMESESVTALIISHGIIRENYPHKLIVQKQNGISALIKS